MPYIFDRFYRSSDAMRTKKGAGLGLYLSKAIIEAHNGHIWIDTDYKKGARIYFHYRLVTTNDAKGIIRPKFKFRKEIFLWLKLKNMPKMSTTVLVEIQQSFDMAEDPLAKQKLLSNAANVIHCPNCGYEGMLAVPVVYHDPEKELLLTFFPPDLRTPVNEQERQIGPIIKHIIDNLPQEKRRPICCSPRAC
jgi:hypothetical protein